MRTLSQQAQVAKLCRQFCKSIGVKCKATSDSFSMGDSVDVSLLNQPPSVMTRIHDALDQYQYGRFNSMEDIYEFSNCRDNIPQTKYLSISNKFDEEWRQRAYDFLRQDGMPALLTDANNERFGNEWASQSVWRLLSGSHQLSTKFWSEITPVEIVTANTDSHIEQHTHTKRGFIMFMVILGGKVSYDQYLTLRDKAIDMGGWYSKKWGKTPGGFAFKESDLADKFLQSITN